MLILLTHANHLYSDRKQVRKMQPYPPLQTLIAAALLRRDGHRVVFFDCTFDRDFISSVDTYQPDLIAVCEDNFNFLTKMCLLENRELAFEIAAAARVRGIPAIVNSSDSTNHPQAYLAAGFNRVILGELEGTLSELCRDWQPKPAQIEYDPARAIVDLDALPMPAWDLLDIEAYRRAWMDAHGYFSLNLAASRGCPYRCNWCAKPVHGDAYRQYSPDRVAAEMECVRDLFAPDQLWFADDIFGLSGKWTREFAGCVERRGVRTPFRMQSRCDLMTRETVGALARAGCIEIWMGAESGSQRILDAMEKGIRVDQIAEARENLRRHGIRACLFLQFGYLGEDWDDIERTVRMVRDVRPDDIGVSVSYPMPNTRFHQIVQEHIGAQANWRDSGDLAMMYEGAFPTEFYRALADALHAEVRGGPAAEAWEKVEQLRCACC
ncbi:MAG TPA: radical SAM protein [Bryobacteraceae bacterium]|nr:radical SAM protein [Bryobacteraceae bacterium]